MPDFGKVGLEAVQAPALRQATPPGRLTAHPTTRCRQLITEQVESIYVNGAVLATLTFLYVSSVPLVFAVPDLETRFWGMFQFGPWSSEQLFDWAANLLAFVPLGFLWSAAFNVRSPARPGWFRATAAICFGPVSIACLALAALAEGLQFWIPLRDPSAHDVLALECGAIAGGGLWLFAGHRVTALLRRFMERLYGVGGPALFRLRWVFIALATFVACLAVNCYANPTQLFLMYRFRSISLHEVAGMLHNAGLQHVRSPLRMAVPSAVMAMLAVLTARAVGFTVQLTQSRDIRSKSRSASHARAKYRLAFSGRS